MKRVEILEVKVNGHAVPKDGPQGAICPFLPKMRVEVKLRSKLKTAIVASRDGKGNYTTRRIGENSEVILRAVANEYLFIHPQNLVQFVWTYQGALKIMSVGVIRHNNQTKFIEHFIFHGPILPQAEKIIFIPGAKAWENLLRLVSQAEIFPAQAQVKTTFPAKPRLSHLVANQAVVYWWNPFMRGYVSQDGYGGNGYGQALLYHGNRMVSASFAAINFSNGTPPDNIKRGTIVQFEQLILPAQHSGHNPRLFGVTVVKT